MGLMAEFERPVNRHPGRTETSNDRGRDRPLVRSGIHIGEVVERDGTLRGIAVHVAARVMAKGAGGDILVSQTTKDICGGTGLTIHRERRSTP